MCRDLRAVPWGQDSASPGKGWLRNPKRSCKLLQELLLCSRGKASRTLKCSTFLFDLCPSAPRWWPLFLVCMFIKLSTNLVSASLFFKVFFFQFYVYECFPVCMYVYHTSAFGSHGTTVTGGCKTPYGCWGLNLVFYKDNKRVLITSEPSPQPLYLYF